MQAAQLKFVAHERCVAFGLARPSFDLTSLLRASLLLASLVVSSLAGFSTAYAQAPGAANANAQGNAQNGKQVFTMQGCYKCHGTDAQGTSGRQDSGPRIGPPRLGLPAFLRFVRNPTGAMLPYAPQDVSDADLTDVFAFLQSFGQAQAAALPPGNPQNGQRFFHDDGCYQCHGILGQGATQTGGSRIGPPQIDFPAFLSYVRQPTNQMPPYTSKAVPDSQVNDIYAYLKSIPLATPSKNIPLLNQ
jgi:mono/diheme cytochrome c family protein